MIYYDMSGNIKAKWDTASSVISQFNEYNDAKLIIRDDGRIVGAFGLEDDVVILLGYAYYKGWLEGGWYYTGMFNVVAMTVDD